MHIFWKELTEGDIRLRDSLQFELKSDFSPSKQKKNVITQEFYIFIPDVLQINDASYSKEEFYKDQTNHIRYKTPEFSFQDLLNENNKRSPLHRLNSLVHPPHDKKHLKLFQDEIKLFGNIVRSSLRKEVKLLIEDLLAVKGSQSKAELWNQKIIHFCQQIQEIKEKFSSLKAQFFQSWPHTHVQKHFVYVGDFISHSIDYFMTGLLKFLKNDTSENFQPSHKVICSLLLEERAHRENSNLEPTSFDPQSPESEYILYRKGLLNKFVLDALLLQIKRKSTAAKYSNLTGSISAAIAMLFYFVLFVWQGEVFVINSTPFIIFTVFLYVIKDRIKERLRLLFHRQAFRLFPDYTTEIFSPDGKRSLGTLTESTSFVSTKDLPEDIKRIRNMGFHTVLESFERKEQVLHYKKEVQLKGGKTLSRRYELNNIFRFNVHQFLQKASNPSSKYSYLEPNQLQLKKMRLPKVYHINIIMFTNHSSNGPEPQVELKKFRLILDKNGIKRVEHL